MKKFWALAIAFAFCAAVGLAGGDLCQIASTGATISQLNAAGRSMVVKTAEGREMRIYWNEETKIEGTLKEGETVVAQASHKNGKIWATSLRVGTVKKPS